MNDCVIYFINTLPLPLRIPGRTAVNHLYTASNLTHFSLAVQPYYYRNPIKLTARKKQNGAMHFCQTTVIYVNIY